MAAKLSVFSSEIPEYLTKRYSLVDGKIQKVVSANMAVGTAIVVEVANLREFSNLLVSLQHNQALSYGVPKVVEEGKVYEIVPEEQKTEGTIARTKDDFIWSNNGGVMFLDHDDEMSKDEFIGTINAVMPELQTVDKIWFPSSSSYIFNGIEQVTGLKGQRLYFLVDNASKIPDIGNTLFRRLWLAGFGRVQIGAAGQLLERSVVDKTVWQSNRLDFASGASCKAPLRQSRGEPIIIEGCRKYLEAAKVILIDGKQDFIYRKMVEDAKQPLKAKSEKVQKVHIEKRLEAMPEAKKAKLRTIYQSAYSSGSLAGDFEITLFKDGQKKVLSVVEILNNLAIYDRCKTLDPIEPEYNGNHKTGILFLSKGEPCLYSKAHGEKTYSLKYEIEKSENDKIFDEMQKDVAEQLAGKITTIPLPWSRLSSGTNALREGTVTIICGASKVGKSFFAMNIVRSIHENGIKWAYLPLEDSKKDWTWRIMAILENNFSMVCDDKSSAELRKEVILKRGPEIMSYLESVTQNPRLESDTINGKKVRRKVTPESTLKWTEAQARSGKRVIFIDPLVQISFGGFNRWEQEETFMQDLCGIAADYKVSLVIVSHTRKKNSDDSGELTVEDMQGSAAFGRLCHTSILLGSTHEMEEREIVRPGGEIEKVMSNRTCVVGAARNGSGSRSKLAFVVDPGSPVFKEIGYLAIKKGKKK